MPARTEVKRRSNRESIAVTQTPAQRKAAERQRLRDAGLVAVTVWINAADRVKLARYVKRLNQRATAQKD